MVIIMAAQLVPPTISWSELPNKPLGLLASFAADEFWAAAPPTMECVKCTVHILCLYGDTVHLWRPPRWSASLRHLCPQLQHLPTGAHACMAMVCAHSLLQAHPCREQ
jgi:hypothetical protein